MHADIGIHDHSIHIIIVGAYDLHTNSRTHVPSIASSAIKTMFGTPTPPHMSCRCRRRHYVFAETDRPSCDCDTLTPHTHTHSHSRSNNQLLERAGDTIRATLASHSPVGSVGCACVRTGAGVTACVFRAVGDRCSRSRTRYVQTHTHEYRR